jgi:hypothetical protein
VPEEEKEMSAKTFFEGINETINAAIKKHQDDVELEYGIFHSMTCPGCDECRKRAEEATKYCNECGRQYDD